MLCCVILIYFVLVWMSHGDCWWVSYFQSLVCCIVAVTFFIGVLVICAVTRVNFVLCSNGVHCVYVSAWMRYNSCCWIVLYIVLISWLHVLPHV